MHPAAKLADIADAMIFEPLLCIPTASLPFKIDKDFMWIFIFVFVYKISMRVSFMLHFTFLSQFRIF